MAKKLFTNAKTEAGLNAAVAAGTLDAHVAFIEEAGNEGIHAKDKTYQTIPSNGTNGQVLVSKDGKGVWTDLDILDLITYGVEWKPKVADPEITRIGNMQYHRTLPIQSKMKGCILNPKTKEVIYWLDDYDWNKKKGVELVELIDVGIYEYQDAELEESGIYYTLGNNPVPGGVESYLNERIAIYLNKTDGSQEFETYATIIGFNDEGQPIIKSEQTIASDINASTYIVYIGYARLDGYDGEVFVYVPEFWIKSWDEPDRKAVRISPVYIDETWEHQPATYVGAYKDTLLNAVPENMGYLSTLEVNTAISVANKESYCKGGPFGSSLSYTEPERTLLGKCITYISIRDFRPYVRKGGKEIMSYKQYKNIIYWLYVIEYANFNSQAPYIEELTNEGYHQGGLGVGFTQDFDNGSVRAPYCYNGCTNELGNGTGTMSIESSTPKTSLAVRWRGIENVFGDIQQVLDGAYFKSNNVYITDNPNEYGSSANLPVLCYVNYKNGTIIEWNLGSTAEIIPKITDSSVLVNMYKCDHAVSSANYPGDRVPSMGGTADSQYRAGIGAINASRNIAEPDYNRGFRSVLVIE